MNEGTSDRVRENNSAEKVKKTSQVPTTSYQKNETSLEDNTVDDHTGLKSTHQRNIYSRLSLSNFFEEFKCVMSSEDDIHLRCALRKDHGLAIPEKEPMFVIVNSSDLSNPSSKELVIKKKSNHTTDNIFAKFLNKYVIPKYLPSTSKDLSEQMFNQPPVTESVSRDEVLMVDINLQSDHEILIDDNDDKDSIVVSYLRNRNVLYEKEGILLTSKKKSSLLESLPKLETIVEDGRPEKSDQTLELNVEFEDHKKEQ